MLENEPDPIKSFEEQFTSPTLVSTMDYSTFPNDSNKTITESNQSECKRLEKNTENGQHQPKVNNLKQMANVKNVNS